MEDGKAKIERFDAKDFAFWNMQIQDQLYYKELNLSLKDKPPRHEQGGVGSSGPSSTGYGQIDIGQECCLQRHGSNNDEGIN